MPISNDEFRAALSNFASGVTVVTTLDNAGRYHGITVSAFCSVSLEPPLVLICIERATASHYAFEESGIFAVSVLGEGQAQMSDQFASPHEDKFAGVEYEIGKLGAPLIAGAITTLECRLRSSLDGGDHSIFVGEVISVRIPGGRPLLYFTGDYHSAAS